MPLLKFGSTRIELLRAQRRSSL